MILRKKGDPEKRHIFGTHPGDLGIVAMAAVITMVFVYLLLIPKNFDALDRALAPAPAPKAPAAAAAPPPSAVQRLQLLWHHLL